MAPTNAQPVGKAILVYGTVKAVAANGTERILGPNSLIYANEHIVTGSDGSVSIAFAGHPEQLMLGRMSDVAVDEDVYASTTPGQGEGGTASVEDIQAALLQNPNFDPTTGLPAPAAGGGVAGAGVGPRGGGRHIVHFDAPVFDSDQMEVIPDSGAETRGIVLDFLDPLQELGTVDTLTTEGAITVTDAVVRISEEGLGGADPDGAGATTGDDTTNTTFIAGTLAVTTTSDLALNFTFVDAPAGLTSNGVGISWSGIGTGTLIGTAGGQTIFTVTIDSDGDYSVVLGGPLDHLAAGEDALDLSFGVQVTDGLVSASANLTVTVEDDSPVIAPAAFDPLSLPNQAGMVSGRFEIAAGADGIDHFNITPPVIIGVQYGHSSEILDDGTTIFHAYSKIDSSELFSLTVKPDGTYTYELVNPNAVGQSTTYDMTTLVLSGSNTWVETNDGAVEISTNSTISVDANGFGVGGNYVGQGEVFKMEFHVPGISNGNDPAMTSPQLVDSVTLTVSLFDGTEGTYLWVADGGVETGTITIDGDGSYVIDPLIQFNTLSIRGVAVDGQGARFSQITTNHDLLPDDMILSFDISAVDNDGDESVVQQLSVHHVAWQPEGQGRATSGYMLNGQDGADDWIAASNHTDIIFGGASGIDIVDYSTSIGSIVVNLDGDGGAAGAPPDVNNPAVGTIAGGNALGDTLSGIEGIVGGKGDDLLIGNSHENYFDGGGGDDALTGGAGADTFVASTGDDRIIDYNKGEGDVVDIGNLLSDASRDNLQIGASSDGYAKLAVIDGGAEVGSVTFETITNDGSMTLDSLLNQVEVKDNNGTL